MNRATINQMQLRIATLEGMVQKLWNQSQLAREPEVKLVKKTKTTKKVEPVKKTTRKK